MCMAIYATSFCQRYRYSMYKNFDRGFEKRLSLDNFLKAITLKN